LPQGRRNITPGTFAGSITGTPLMVVVLPAFAAASAAFQLTIAT
jgi:hypothetical protein